LLLLIAMFLWPADFQVQSKGTLEPVDRSDVFAETDGIVMDVFVKQGDLAEKKQELVRLRNTEAEIALTQVEGQRIVSQERIDSLQRTLLDERQLRPDERARLHGELAEEREKLINYNAQWELCKKKVEDLDIRSPIRGLVVTWDLYNRLIHRPVQRGQSLLRVADPDGPWQLELHMPEDRMGFIAAAQKTLAKEGALKATYILATDPGTKHYGTVTEVGHSAEVHGEEGSTVLIKASIHKSDLSDLRPGATVTAKIYCGRRPIGYVWFHDLITFVQSRILFKLW